MKKISLEEMLGTMYDHPSADLTITISSDDFDVFTIKLGKNKQTIKLTYTCDQTVEIYQTVNEAVLSIEKKCESFDEYFS